MTWTSSIKYPLESYADPAVRRITRCCPVELDALRTNPIASTQLSVPVALRRESAVGFVGNEPNGLAQARSHEVNSRWAGIGSVWHTHGSRLAEVQFLELLGLDGAGGARHQVGALGGFGEGNAVADVGQARV